MCCVCVCLAFASAEELRRHLGQVGWRERGAGREGRWSADESGEEEDETRDSSVELLLVSVNARSLQIALDLEGCPHESEGLGAAADANWSHGQGETAGGQVRVVATGLSARHVSSAGNALCEAREELSVHLASLVVGGSLPGRGRACQAGVRAGVGAGRREGHDASEPEMHDVTLLQVVACPDESRVWARDVANALKIMGSEAAAGVKAHLLTPLVACLSLIESCFVGSGWDCQTKGFLWQDWPPEAVERCMRTAEAELALLMRAPLAGCVRWVVVGAATGNIEASGPSTPTPSVSRHSPAYAGMGVWLEKMLRARGDGGAAVGFAGSRRESREGLACFGAGGAVGAGAAVGAGLGTQQRHSWGGPGDALGGLGLEAELASVDSVRLAVWCGPVSVGLPVSQVTSVSLTIKACLAVSVPCVHVNASPCGSARA